MMRNTNCELNALIDIHKDTPALIVGGAPDIGIFPYKKFEGLLFSMNDVPLRCLSLFNTDYWIFANKHWAKPWLRRDAKALEKGNSRRIFMATSIFCYEDRDILPFQIKRSTERFGDKLVFFDQAHPGDGSYDHGTFACCEANEILQIEKKIQRILSEKFGLVEDLYSVGSTVALHALALALIMGCKPISLIGVKIPRLQSEYKYYGDAKIESLVKKYGTYGPYSSSDCGVIYEGLNQWARTLVKGPLKSIQKRFFLDDRYKEENQLCIFDRDYEQIRLDFESIIRAGSLSGNVFYNYSSQSVLSDIEGVFQMNDFLKSEENK